MSSTIKTVWTVESLNPPLVERIDTLSAGVSAEQKGEAVLQENDINNKILKTVIFQLICTNQVNF